MSDTDDDSKEELYQEFLEESEEMISEMEQFSISLESNPNDMEAIHGIFRCAHSIKGNSAFFGLTQVQTFCHQFESFLDLVRERTIAVDRDLVHFILDGADFLKAITGRLRVEGMGVAIRDDEQAYFEQLQSKTVVHSDESKMEVLRGELISYFARMREEGLLEETDHPVKELYELINRYAPDLVREQKKGASVGGVRWIFDTLDVTEEYADLRAVVEEAKSGAFVDNPFERIMNAVNGLLSKHLSAELEDPVEGLQEFKDDFEMFYQDEIGIDEMMVISIEEALQVYADSGLSEVQPQKAPPPVARVEEGKSATTGGESAVKTKTVRINESLLDELIDHVGELITINELFNIIQRKLEQKQTEGLTTDLKNTNQAFGELSTQLQHVLYQIRKAPFERAYSKLPSIVRGIAKNSGKEISLSATGGDTEVDKSLLDKIETMLVHCVRNSCDHGIETPDERMEKGKPAEGRISISAIARDNQVLLVVEDDGRGADPTRICDKAVEKGLVSREACGMMAEREVLELMLLPGFSTAAQITETSGRGVGMDVLLSSVKEMGGSLSLSNKRTGGLKIEIRLPLAYTTRIKLGLTLALGKSVFLVAAEQVRESFRVKREDVSTVEGKGEVVRRWGNIYPVIRLSRLFDIPPRFPDITEAICLLVESKGTVACLVVDELIGQRQIVYKQLNLRTKEPSAFDGVSILDGRNMALILSIDGVVQQFQR
ncbi:MAG: chemotaxis protein CheA [Nitrospinae bacterium]|nr:chemotaxis protein CheA [Nitrospinota bacterium]